MGVDSMTPTDSSPLCACMGPMYGEPYCYCIMKARGLPLNTKARKVDTKRLNEALDLVIKKRAARAITTK
jgi:hypothetical protein